MTAACTAAGCGRPVSDQATLCAACTAELRQALAETPALVDDLGLQLSRQTATGQRNGPRASEKPLPYDTGASDALEHLRGVLVGWVRVLHADPEPMPADDLPAMSRWLLARLERIRHHEAASDIHAEILDAAAWARRAVDRHGTEKVYAGICGAGTPDPYSECLAPVYARLGATSAVCGACGAEHDVAQRRAWMLQAVTDMVLPATQAAAAVTALWGKTDTDDNGHTTHRQLTPAAVRGMAHRQRIAPHAHDTRRGAPIPLYRVGDVLDELTRREHANERKSA